MGSPRWLAMRSSCSSYSHAAVCGSISPRMRRIDFSGTAAGARRVSQAILKLLCRSSGGDAPLVSECNSGQIPRQIVPDCGKPGINRSGSVPTGERKPEFVAFTKGVMRLVKNELGSVDSEVLRSNYLPIHSRLKSDRAM